MSRMGWISIAVLELGSRTVGRNTSSRERRVHLLGISSFRTARKAGSACIESAIVAIRTGCAVYFALYRGETLPEFRKRGCTFLRKPMRTGRHNKLATHL